MQNYTIPNLDDVIEFILENQDVIDGFGGKISKDEYLIYVYIPFNLLEGFAKLVTRKEIVQCELAEKWLIIELHRCLNGDSTIFYGIFIRLHQIFNLI